MNRILHGDCLFMLKLYVPDASVDLIVTSPPYAQQRMGGIPKDRYERWLLERAKEFRRVLKPTGSFVLNLWPHTEQSGQFKGQEATYVMDLIIALRDAGWSLLDTYAWRKTCTVPGNFGNKLKNGWEPFYHLAKQTKIKFCLDQVLRPAKQGSIDRANRAKGKDFERRESASGSNFGMNRSKAGRHYTTEAATGSGFSLNNDPEAYIKRRPRNNGSSFGTHDNNCNGVDGMVYPDNVIECAPETRNLGHDSVFPEPLPRFFINLMTRTGDTVLDPFSGSGTTAFVAQQLGRKVIAIDIKANNVRLIRDRLS
jgi:site-specific DNA-methyltransferase (adenine-specific)